MSADDIVRRLAELKDLHDRGALTPAEFSAAKAVLLGTGPVSDDAERSSAHLSAAYPTAAHQVDAQVTDSHPIGAFSAYPAPAAASGWAVPAPRPHRGRRVSPWVLAAAAVAAIVLVTAVVVVVSRAVGGGAPAQCRPEARIDLPPEGRNLLDAPSFEAGATTPDGREVWFSGGSPRVLKVADACTSTIARTLGTPNTAEDMAFSPDETRVYMADSFEPTVTVVDRGTGAVLARIPVADFQYQKRLCVTPDGTWVFATDSYGDKVSVIDARSLQVVAAVPFGGGSGFAGAWGVASSADGRTAYVTRPGANEVVVVDVASQTVVRHVRVGDYPRGIVRDRDRIYVANSSSGSISVIDAGSLAVLVTVPVGDWPDAMAVSGDGRRVAAVSSESSQAFVLDVATPTTPRTVTLPQVMRPDGEKATSAPAKYFTYDFVALGFGGDRIYVGNGVGNWVIPVP